MVKNFRAWFLPDADTKDGLLKFVMSEKHDQWGFQMEEWEDCFYPFEIPFFDEGWLVEQSTGTYDINGVEIFEGDIVELVKEHEAYVLSSIFADYPLGEYTHGEIYWLNEGWSVCQKGLGATELSEFQCCGDPEHGSALRVIGNKHEGNKV